MTIKTEHYRKDEERHQARLKAKQTRVAENQHFLATFFPNRESYLQKKAMYDEQIVNEFVIVARYLLKRQQWVYEVFSPERLMSLKRTKILEKGISYMPSTGGKQKYKTVRRDV